MNIRIIRRYVAIPILLLFGGTSYVLLSTGYWSLAGPMLGGLIGAVIGIILILGYDVDAERISLPANPVDSRISVVFTAGYIVSTILIYDFVTYEQPWMHYLIFGLYAGYVGYEITSGASRQRVVAQILVLCFFMYWSVQFAFPSGMFAPDTRVGYLPAIQSALESGVIRSQLIYLGHLVYVTEFTVVSGLSAEIAYYLLATLVLTGTTLVLSVADVTIPIQPRQVTLYGALIFGCMSWTLSRGFLPNKLNFFYPLILLIGMAAFGASMFSGQLRGRWMTIGAIIAPSIIFGHQFSAGAALIFLLAVGAFVALVKLVNLDYEATISKSAVLFVAAYGIALFGNPIHQGGLTDRLARIILSIVGGGGRAYASVGGLAGPGRYSQLSVDFLLMNTSAQALLFAMSVLGVVVAFRRINIGFDFSIFWMGALGLFLLAALVFNSTDTQPQRFYAYLALFGLNISAGMLFLFIEESGIEVLSRGTVVVLVAAFAVLSLFSPVAGLNVSPAGDEIPHYQKFQTVHDDTSVEWADSHVETDRQWLAAVYSSSSLPYNKLDQNTVTVAHSRIPPGSLYLYSEWTQTTGVALDVASTGIGSRGFGFLRLDEDVRDDMVYSNGKSTVYVNR